jgi:pSer/pThr/pTyr-binding forkhead associated (FHA) protein
MKIIIQSVSERQSDQLEQRFEGDVLRIGRASDQDIRIDEINLPLSIGEITESGGQLILTAKAPKLIRLNGGEVRQQTLKAGDQIVISGTEIVIESATPIEGRMSVSNTAPRSKKSAAATPILAAVAPGPSKRRLSWAAIIAIAYLGWISPWSTTSFTTEETSSSDPPSAVSMVQVTSEEVWSTGPLHNVHRSIGDDCTACHETPFEPVTDQACLSCHESTPHHFDPLTFHVADSMLGRCAECHVEHVEPSHLILRDDQGCTDCHADIDNIAGAPSQLRAVSSWSAGHPEFKVSIPRLEQAGRWLTERISIDSPLAKSSSNLIFPHSVHMNPNGIEGPKGPEQLNCGSCHQPDEGEIGMRPVSMEQHCSSCHLLTFDPDHPDRELPHGEPDELLLMMEEFYARRTLIGATLAAGRPAFDAERPGRTNQLDEAARAEALRLAKELAVQTAEDIFERTTCAICHDVTRRSDGVTPAWDVAPVYINQHWMPLSQFDHGAHASETCESCHAAETSLASSDILMPDIASCQTCHGDEHTEDQLVSVCLDCHSFHLDRFNPMVQFSAELERQSSVLSANNIVPISAHITKATAPAIDPAQPKGTVRSSDQSVIQKGDQNSALHDAKAGSER